MLRRRLEEMEKVQVNNNEQELLESTEEEKKIEEQDKQDGMEEGNKEPEQKHSTFLHSLKMACYGCLAYGAYRAILWCDDQYRNSWLQRKLAIQLHRPSGQKVGSTS
jgi:cytoskeletal protein RodZ